MKIKLTLLTCLFLFASIVTKAQNWGGGIDDDKLNFGFTFQYISAEYKILKKADWRSTYFIDNNGTREQITNPLNSISSEAAPGFGIGFVVNNSLTKNLDLRFTPTLVFSDRKMKYTYENGLFLDQSTDQIIKSTKGTMFDVPLGIKVKSDRIMNFRAYMLGGLKYSVDMASDKRTSNESITNEMEKNLRTKKSFLSYEAGIGFDIYFEYFKMSPEFKLAYSFKDVIKHEGNAFDTPIDKAKLRHFTFSLFFE
jgi:hypothetical protein